MTARPRPELFRILVRSVVACVLVELVTFAEPLDVDTPLPGRGAWAYVLGWLGAGAGAGASA